MPPAEAMQPGLGVRLANKQAGCSAVKDRVEGHTQVSFDTVLVRLQQPVLAGAQLQDLVSYAAYPDLYMVKCVYCKKDNEDAAPSPAAAAAGGFLALHACQSNMSACLDGLIVHLPTRSWQLPAVQYKWWPQCVWFAGCSTSLQCYVVCACCRRGNCM
jgi:hypothetical protein